jgi:ketosteroid isomerase-like protein
MATKVKSVFVFLFLFSNLYAQEYSGSGADINIILENIKEFSNAYVNADYDKLTKFYCSDGKIFPAGADIIIGHEDIKIRWILPKGESIHSHNVTPSEIKIIDNYAYDFGYYKGASTSKKGKANTFNGKYVIVWRKEGSDWKIYLDIWNRIDANKSK